MSRCTLYRGNHKLPHQSQVLQRDLNAEQIERNRGRRALAFRVTNEELRHRREGRPGTGLPYRFIVRDPRSAGLAWTAFYDRRALDRFVKAYGLRVHGSTRPGSTFEIEIPTHPRLQKLVCK